MGNFKTISIITIVGLLGGMSTAASASSADQPTAAYQQTLQSNSNKAVNANFVKTAAKRTVVRIVEPLPAQARKIKPSIKNSYGRVIYSHTASQNEPRKFVYNSTTQRTQTPVYFGGAALNAR